MLPMMEMALVLWLKLRYWKLFPVMCAFDRPDGEICHTPTTGCHRVRRGSHCARGRREIPEGADGVRLRVYWSEMVSMGLDRTVHIP